MKTANEIKQFFKSTFGLSVRVRTIPGKSGWQQVWIPSASKNPMELIYTSHFSPDLRKQCIIETYGENVHPDAFIRDSYGNISAHSISLLAPQWVRVIEKFSK